MFQLIRIVVMTLVTFILCSCQNNNEPSSEGDCPVSLPFEIGDTFSYQLSEQDVLTYIIDYEVVSTYPIAVEVNSERESYTITFNSGMCNSANRELAWYEQAIFNTSSYKSISQDLLGEPQSDGIQIAEERDWVCQDDLEVNQDLFNYNTRLRSCQGEVNSTDLSGRWESQAILIPRMLPSTFKLFVDDSVIYSLKLTTLYLAD